MDADVTKLFNTFKGITHECIPTGVIPYDILAGGDIQLGSCIAIGGAEGAGKSTAYLQMCKYWIEVEGRSVCYVDAEKSGAFMKQLDSFDLRKHSQFADGFDISKGLPRLWWVNNINTYNEFQNLCKHLITLKQQGKVNYEYIILDSVSALAQTKMIEGDCEAAAVAYDALPISKLIKSVRGILYNAGITLCFVAQASSNIGAGMYDPEWTLKLTRAIRHCCDLLFCIEKRDYKSYKIFDEGMAVQGNEATDIEVGYYAFVWTIKNRAVRSQKLKVPYIYGKGIDNIRFVMSVLEDAKYVSARNYKGVTTYKLNFTGKPEDEIKIEGWDNYKTFLIKNYNDIVKHLYEIGKFDLGSKNYMITAETDDVELTDAQARALENQEAHSEIANYANDQKQNTTEIEPEAIPNVEIISTAPEDVSTEDSSKAVESIENIEKIEAVLNDA